MATLRLRYVHSFVDKTGRVRFYFRYRGQRWALPGHPGTTEFTETYDALRRECLTKPVADNIVFGPGTCGLCDRKISRQWRFHVEGAGDDSVLPNNLGPTERFAALR
jgi:hypothetical protein